MYASFKRTPSIQFCLTNSSDHGPIHNLTIVAITSNTFELNFLLSPLGSQKKCLTAAAANGPVMCFVTFA